MQVLQRNLAVDLRGVRWCRSGSTGPQFGTRADGHCQCVWFVWRARSGDPRSVPDLRCVRPHHRATHVRRGDPPGVDDGTTLRLSGRGQLALAAVPMATCMSTSGSAPPDLPREGNDLVHDFYIPFTQAVIGAELEYETLDGSETFVVPGRPNRAPSSA